MVLVKLVVMFIKVKNYKKYVLCSLICGTLCKIVIIKFQGVKKFTLVTYYLHVKLSEI